MVLIISETSDRSTDYVVEYLRSYECPFIRINEDCSANILYQTSLNNGNASLKFIFNDRVVNYETISCVWFLNLGNEKDILHTLTKLPSCNIFYGHFFNEITDLFALELQRCAGMIERNEQKNMGAIAGLAFNA